MKPFVVKPVSYLAGEVLLPGDKSIAHRAAILGALSRGTTSINNFPANNDCFATLNALRKLGVKINYQPDRNLADSISVTVYGKGLRGLKKPKGDILTGDSGTTLRLLLGVIAGQDFSVKLAAGKSLSRRPMRRVTQPLRSMGARIKSKTVTRNSKIEEYPPITIHGGNLKAINYRMPVASAQVKSAILLAGLYAKGNARVIEPVPTRDHTERMLKLFKAKIKVSGKNIIVGSASKLTSPGDIYVPGDISSCAFFMVMGAILKASRISIKNTSLNPTRAGIIKVLKRMGAVIQIKDLKSKNAGFEPMGDIIVKTSALKGVVVRKEEIPSLIDELPVLMVAASLAKGNTTFKAVQELRVKETDRIRSICENLKKMGAVIKVIKSKGSENIVITGVKELQGARVKSFGDHRTAMSLIVAGLAAKGPTYIDSISCISKSFPGFISTLKSLRA